MSFGLAQRHLDAAVERPAGGPIAESGYQVRESGRSGGGIVDLEARIRRLERREIALQLVAVLGIAIGIVGLRTSVSTRICAC